MADIFIGSEAMAAGRVTRHELSRWYRRVHHGVYAPKDAARRMWSRLIPSSSRASRFVRKGNGAEGRAGGG